MRRRSILLVALAILFLTLSIIAYLRWDAWFSIPHEPAYTLPCTPDRVIVTPTEDGLRGRNVNWISGCDQPYRLEVWESGKWKSLPVSMSRVDTEGGTTFQYHATLNLTGDSIPYTILGEGDSVLYRNYLSAAPLLADSLVYIGDIQDIEPNSSDRLFSEIRKKYPRTSAWIFGGDAIERGHNGYWDIWYRSILPVAGNTPLIAVTGNHEHDKSLFRKLDPRWVDFFHFPPNSPTLTGSNYFIDYRYSRVICINSEGLDRPSRIIGTRKWLKELLSDTAHPFHIVVFHHAVYPIRSGRFHPIMYFCLRDILEDPQYAPALVLQGHDHAYARDISRDRKGRPQPPVYVISTTSRKQYLNSMDPDRDKLGSGDRWYQLITASTDTLRYLSYLEDHSLYDQVVIVRSPEGSYKVLDQGNGIPEVHKLSFPDTPKGLKEKKKYLQGAERRRERIF